MLLKLYFEVMELWREIVTSLAVLIHNELYAEADMNR